MSQKTKRTIIENEQLRKEVQFHTHQTMTLLKENEKLIAENHDLERTINLLKEVCSWPLQTVANIENQMIEFNGNDKYNRIHLT